MHVEIERVDIACPTQKANRGASWCSRLQVHVYVAPGDISVPARCHVLIPGRTVILLPDHAPVSTGRCVPGNLEQAG
jgi:hypothetical protein